jgi:phosphonate transport system substrate-binding protein
MCQSLVILRENIGSNGKFGVYWGKLMIGMVLKFLLLLGFTGNAFAESHKHELQPFQLALSAVMLGEQQDSVLRWKNYLEKRLDRTLTFVQRRSYQELSDAMLEDKIDAGWVCGRLYVQNKTYQRLLAVPVWKGKPVYQSYLIVPKEDSTTQSILDLRGKMFAYSDPLSNSGQLVPRANILRQGSDPKTYFRKVLITYSHRKNIEAVAAGLVNGSNVDGYIYDQLAKIKPDLISKTRIVQKSDYFGFPPIVARWNLPDKDFNKLQSVLVGMNKDEEGRKLLSEMGLDGFIAGNDHLYDGIAALTKEVGTGEKKIK